MIYTEGSAEGPSKLCSHKVNVTFVSTDGMFYSRHIQWFKEMERTDNWMQEDPSFTRRV